MGHNIFFLFSLCTPPHGSGPAQIEKGTRIFSSLIPSLGNDPCHKTKYIILFVHIPPSGNDPVQIGRDS